VSCAPRGDPLQGFLGALAVRLPSESVIGAVGRILIPLPNFVYGIFVLPCQFLGPFTVRE
jgi:hypothetical protein